MFYLDLFRELDNSEVRYLLVGGLAMSLHGVPRTTMDVDIVIAMDGKNVDAFILAASRLELSPVMPISLADLKIKDKRESWIRDKNMVVFALRNPDPGTPTVDILIAPKIDLTVERERAWCIDVEGITIPLASIEDMIELKSQAGRLQDISDIEILEKLREQ